MQDATTALLRAVFARLDGSDEVRIEEIRSRAWASATFAGARHELCLRLEGEGAAAAAERLSHRLACADFALRGHLVADILLHREEGGCASGDRPCVRVRVEALTVEDG